MNLQLGVREELQRYIHLICPLITQTENLFPLASVFKLNAKRTLWLTTKKEL